MSRVEAYELAIATALLSMFGQPLFQNFLNGQFERREQLSLALIMVFVGLYGLFKLYIAYRKQHENTQQRTSATRGTSRSSVGVPSRRAATKTTAPIEPDKNRLQADSESPTDIDDDENPSEQSNKKPLP